MWYIILGVEIFILIASIVVSFIINSTDWYFDWGDFGLGILYLFLVLNVIAVALFIGWYFINKGRESLGI
jgi:hypothetical protein